MYTQASGMAENDFEVLLRRIWNQ